MAISATSQVRVVGQVTSLIWKWNGEKKTKEKNLMIKEWMESSEWILCQS